MHVTHIVTAARVLTRIQLPRDQRLSSLMLMPGERWPTEIEISASRERGATADQEPEPAAIYQHAAAIADRQPFALARSDLDDLNAIAIGRRESQIRAPEVTPFGARASVTVDVAHELAVTLERARESFAAGRPFEAAARLLWRIVWIHGFTDGNGRTSRAACYAALLAADPALRAAHDARHGAIGRARLTLPERLERNRSTYVMRVNMCHEAQNRGRVAEMAPRLGQLAAALAELAADQVAARPSADDLADVIVPLVQA